MFRALVVYGTRPEAIKMAPLIRAMQAHPDIEPIVVTTGQHPTMVDQVHADYGISSDHSLDVFEVGQSLDQLTARILRELSPVIRSESPDVVVVQGDTTSCVAGALSALHAQVPIAHLEAGMRSHDIRAPFPEESYRRLVAQMATLHLAASEDNRDNLLREGIADSDILIVGSTAIDALQTVLAQPVPLGELQQVVDSSSRLVVLTCHRRESWGEPMREIGRAVADVASRHTDVTFLLSAHPNPIVRDALLPPLQGLDNVVVTEPLGYQQFAAVMQRAYLLVTDSGGVQAEAPSLEVPTLVLRTTTEYGETVRAGSARLVGTDPELITREMDALLSDAAARSTMQIGYSPYGDGRAGERSAQAIVGLLRDGAHGTAPYLVTPGAGIVGHAS